MSGLKDAFYGDHFCPPFQSHSSTSRDAALSIANHIGPLHKKIIAYLTDHPEGATDEQIADETGMAPNTERPRRIELARDGVVIEAPRYGLTRAGRRATVWVLA